MNSIYTLCKFNTKENQTKPHQFTVIFLNKFSNILQIHKKLFKYIFKYIFAFIFHLNHGIYGPLSINNNQENSPLLFLADL